VNASAALSGKMGHINNIKVILFPYSIVLHARIFALLDLTIIRAVRAPFLRISHEQAAGPVELPNVKKEIFGPNTPTAPRAFVTLIALSSARKVFSRGGGLGVLVSKFLAKVE